ncbi:dTDP-glucose 4,6-dehydratase [Acidisarcina polymorpha]|uniref:dTDP-glucose 4,6-dehydratase n=1 Tax=Acidisarcina polymorpha TaxID=2211140 RepID=A0A2Z5FYP0_9BACT|nr:NAD-dependent epimerase/dehydratase family protein [Acidisarcina polymorpha]AXC11535.1 dTDP-glucose 4,6-dehydratase [Acidisarcina polymorpha]
MNSIVQDDIKRILQEPLPWQSFAGAEVLVTGAAGFLPAYMVETLMFLNRFVLSKPAKVSALVRNEERAMARFAEYQGRDDLRILVQNVSDPLRVSTPFDYIIHAASNASPVAYLADPAGTISANMLGTYHLLNAAAQNKACQGFLFFSSGEVYGAVKGGPTPLAENEGGFLDPLGPRACYGEGKRAGETMCASWARQYGVPARIVRPGHTYGPRMRLDDGRVYADFVRDILNGGPINMLSDGSARRPFCYLADATTAFFTVLLKGEAGQAYNVVNPDAECSIAELADRLAVLYKDEGIYVKRFKNPDMNSVQSAHSGTPVSAEKLRSLGWRSRTTIEEGFKRTVDSYRSTEQ